MKNFICHGRLDCNFGPNVNFVVGRNGSKYNPFSCIMHGKIKICDGNQSFSISQMVCGC